MEKMITARPWGDRPLLLDLPRNEQTYKRKRS